MMRVPLVLRGPVARGNQDSEFLEALRQRSIKAHVFAEFLGAVRELRAAQQRVERPAHPAARPGCDLLIDLALCVAHVAFAKRPEARLAKFVHDSSFRIASRHRCVLSGTREKATQPLGKMRPYAEERSSPEARLELLLRQ